MKGGLQQQSSRTRGLAGALGPHVGKWEGWTISSDNYLGWHTGLSFTLLSPFPHSLNHQPQLPVRTCILITCSVLRVCMYYHFMSAPYEALIHASRFNSIVFSPAPSLDIPLFILRWTNPSLSWQFPKAFHAFQNFPLNLESGVLGPSFPPLQAYQVNFRKKKKGLLVSL